MMRFQYILENYPNYSRRDQVYYHVAEMLFRAQQNDDALVWYEKILTEFPESRYASDAKKRIDEIKAVTP